VRVTSYSDTLQQGDTISCYQIEEVLGRGGFAVTYLAVDLNLDVHVAIKEYLPREIIHRDEHLNVSARRPEFAEDYNIGLSNFAREAKTLARFKHLNIVRVHQVIHKYNTAYMVMDYEHGRELAEVLEDRTSLPEDELRSILFPIFDGVEEIHRHGLAHRDIKPSNIYLRDNGSPVLLDFGAARYTMSETTQQLTAVVTVGYTPIEQYNVSENDQGPWSDIYALAAVLYEAVTGEMPVDSVTRASSSLTNSSDPLAPVANKAQQHYSDHFLNAIDWGLNMEAEDRPQSIAQWRDAFNGVVKPAEDYKPQQQPTRPVRKSKLKTRAANLGEITDAPRYVDTPQRPYESDPRLSGNAPDPRLSVDVRTTRFDPNFDNDVDDVEIVPLNPDNHAEMPPPVSQEYAPLASDTAAGETKTAQRPVPDSPFASNPAPRAAAQPAANATLNDTLNNLAATSDHPTHTQELRKVLRRDIVRRDAPPAAKTPERVSPAPPPQAQSSIQAPPSYRETPDAYESPREHPERRMAPPRQHIDRNEIDFDDTDWDYEPPAPPSKLKWIAPLIGLSAIVGGSLLYVNKPELFKLPTGSGPDMTVEMALEKARDKISSNELIFPAGESALDYYQLILDSDPNNAEALGGVASIQDEIKKQIIDNVDSDNLTEANKLLSRANDANLQIEGGLNTSNAAPANIVDNQLPSDSQSTTVAIDQTASPWVAQQVDDIEALLDAGDYASAETMFREVDKYISDGDLSDSLRNRIEAGKSAESTITPLSENDDTVITRVVNEPIVEATDLPILSNDSVTENNVTTAVIEAVRQEPETPVIAEPPAPEVAPVPVAEQEPAPIPEVEQKIAVVESPETLPSAPRRSFIEGNDATAQHLNQLRLAIEGKSLQQVLQISDSLPEERTEFLRKLFQRYDRLDVTIDSIERGANSATAKLSVAMFNQRSDGSYYSAGKWNDVKLSTSRDSGQWQPIQW
jgi:serine/threonine protein kinase